MNTRSLHTGGGGEAAQRRTDEYGCSLGQRKAAGNGRALHWDKNVISSDLIMHEGCRKHSTKQYRTGFRVQIILREPWDWVFVTHVTGEQH